MSTPFWAHRGGRAICTKSIVLGRGAGGLEIEEKDEGKTGKKKLKKKKQIIALGSL